MECFREDKYILEGDARQYLAKFLFFGKDPYKRVKHLSGGEKVRLKLSMLLYDETNLLILDEPTNHLDIDSIEALEDALEDFKGTILFISHDRYFINKVCNRIVAVEENKFAIYPGNYDDYKKRNDEKRLAQEQPKPARNLKAARVADTCGNTDKKQDLSILECDIKSIEDEVKEIDKSMSAEGLDHVDLNSLYLKKEELNERLDKMIEAWMNSSN